MLLFSEAPPPVTASQWTSCVQYLVTEMNISMSTSDDIAMADGLLLSNTSQSTPPNASVSIEQRP